MWNHTDYCLFKKWDFSVFPLHRNKLTKLLKFWSWLARRGDSLLHLFFDWFKSILHIANWFSIHDNLHTTTNNWWIFRIIWASAGTASCQRSINRLTIIWLAVVWLVVAPVVTWRAWLLSTRRNYFVLFDSFNKSNFTVIGIVLDAFLSDALVALGPHLIKVVLALSLGVMVLIENFISTLSLFLQ